MEKLHSLINEVLEITYGKYGAQWRKDLYENNRVKYHTLLSEGNWYEHVHNAELEGEKLKRRVSPCVAQKKSRQSCPTKQKKIHTDAKSTFIKTM